MRATDVPFFYRDGDALFGNPRFLRREETSRRGISRILLFSRRFRAIRDYDGAELLNANLSLSLSLSLSFAPNRTKETEGMERLERLIVMMSPMRHDGASDFDG